MTTFYSLHISLHILDSVQIFGNKTHLKLYVKLNKSKMPLNERDLFAYFSGKILQFIINEVKMQYDFL